MPNPDVTEVDGLDGVVPVDPVDAVERLVDDRAPEGFELLDGHRELAVDGQEPSGLLKAIVH